MNILIISSVSSLIEQFLLNNIQILKDLGANITIATNFETGHFLTNNHGQELKEKFESENIKCLHIPFTRNPLKKSNYSCKKLVDKLLLENSYDLIDCHSPVGGLISRLSARKIKDIKVMYTAHGFHFYKGCPTKNKIIYKNIEKFLARYTDALITMNKEDYFAAQEFKLKKNGKVYFINGVGLDITRYVNKDFNIEDKKIELGMNNGDLNLLAIGELIARKNYFTMLEVMTLLPPNIRLYICGKGELEDKLKTRVKELKLEDKIIFLGFRNDIPELLHTCDIYIMPSFQEGLPRATMEAMAAGKPVIASSIRGNVDLIDEGKGGFLVNPKDINGFVKAIKTLINNKDLQKQFSLYNLEKIKINDINEVGKEMKNIYTEVLY